MLRIIALRPLFNERTKRWDTPRNYAVVRGASDAANVQELFTNLESLVAQVNEKQRWNLFFTLAHGKADSKANKGFGHIDSFYFDIDHIDAIDRAKALEINRLLAESIGVDASSLGVVVSGNGVQIHLQLSQIIENEFWFDENKAAYKILADRIQDNLRSHGFTDALVDTNVFNKGAIPRLPGTENRKSYPGQDEKLDADHEPELNRRTESYLVQVGCVPQSFDIRSRAGLRDITPEEKNRSQVPGSIVAWPDPDGQAVLNGCEFLKWVEIEPESVSEPQWYASLSILGNLYGRGSDKSRELVHRVSSGHPSYTPEETDAKLDQALAASNARTCQSIDFLWGKCSTCKFNGLVKSPILIQGPDYIKTEKSGFYGPKLNARGEIVGKTPAYDDLVKFFYRETSYRIVGTRCYIWKGTHYSEVSQNFLLEFAEKHFNPKPLNTHVQEFRAKVMRAESKPEEWFTDTTAKKMNFQNGILDLTSMQFGPHSKGVGFRSVLPYDYDPNADAPRFKRFLEEVTVGRPELSQILLEFAGYAFSGEKPWLQKALLLSGEGRNGKSVFMDVLKKLAGPGYYSGVSLGDLQNEQSRALLDGKLFNLSEETSSRALSDSTHFKNLVSGGLITMKFLYVQTVSVEANTKLITACNELPRSRDATAALFRRLIIVPFDAKFSQGDAGHDPFILDKLSVELPGILNMVLEGWHRLKKQGQVTESAAVTEQLNEYRDTVEFIRPWFFEIVDVAPYFSYHDVDRWKKEKHFVPLRELYGNYRADAKERSYFPENFDAFVKQLKPMIENYKSRHGRLTTGKKVVGLYGVSIRKDTQDF